MRRPSQRAIETFLERSRSLPVSYGVPGILERPPSGFNVDEASGIIGNGPVAFERAKCALLEWRHFGLGWVMLFPHRAPIEPGVDVAVLIRHLGFWSLNGCRVLHSVGGGASQTRFGFAYGTLNNHAEMGEELFEVRVLQARFRRESVLAMKRAVSG